MIVPDVSDPESAKPISTAMVLEKSIVCAATS
jgi:hypothetical protein